MHSGDNINDSTPLLGCGVTADQREAGAAVPVGSDLAPSSSSSPSPAGAGAGAGTGSDEQLFANSAAGATDPPIEGGAAPASGCCSPAPPQAGSGYGSRRGSEYGDARFVCNICLDAVKDPVITQCGHLYCWPCLYRWMCHGSDGRGGGGSMCPVCKAGVSKANVIPIFIRGAEDPRDSSSRDRDRGRGSDAAAAAEGGGMDGDGGTSGSSSGSSASIPGRPAAHRPDPQPNTEAVDASLLDLAAQFGTRTFPATHGYFPSLFGLLFQQGGTRANRAAGAGAGGGEGGGWQQHNAHGAAFAAGGTGGAAQHIRALTQAERQQEVLSKVLIGVGFAVFFCLFFI